MKMSLTQHTLVILVVIGFANAKCDDCNEMTEVCVGVGDSSYCECRPSLYRVDGVCIETNSYSSKVELAEGAYGIDEWTEELADPESEEFLNLSRAICAAFDEVLQRHNTFQDDYYGCKIVAFFEGSTGAIVLSFYKDTTDITSSDLETILMENLPGTFNTSTLTTRDADECELSLDDCDPYLGICTGTGATGYTCSCIDTSEDVSPEGFPGRNCIVKDPKWNIVWISAGASVGLFILLLILIVFMSQFVVTGSPVSRSEEDKQVSEKRHSEKDKKTDERPLHQESNEDEGGVANDAFEITEEQPTPENIFDIDEEQMAKLAHIHSIIENHHKRPVSLILPNAQTANSHSMKRVPSADYSPDHRQNSAIYQNSRQSHKYGKPSLVRLPSGEYLEPMTISHGSPQRQNLSRTPSRPTSYNFVEDAASGIYATRFPSFVEKTSTSRTPSEPYLSRQSSSVFFPSSPRHSRNLSSTSTVYYNK